MGGRRGLYPHFPISPHSTHSRTSSSASSSTGSGAAPAVQADGGGAAVGGGASAMRELTTPLRCVRLSVWARAALGAGTEREQPGLRTYAAHRPREAWALRKRE